LESPSIETPQLERRLWIPSRRSQTLAAHVVACLGATLAGECDLSAHQLRDARIKAATEKDEQ